MDLFVGGWLAECEVMVMEREGVEDADGRVVGGKGDERVYGR